MPYYCPPAPAVLIGDIYATVERSLLRMGHDVAPGTEGREDP